MSLITSPNTQNKADRSGPEWRGAGEIDPNLVSWHYFQPKHRSCYVSKATLIASNCIGRTSQHPVHLIERLTFAASACCGCETIGGISSAFTNITPCRSLLPVAFRPHLHFFIESHAWTVLLISNHSTQRANKQESAPPPIVTINSP